MIGMELSMNLTDVILTGGAVTWGNTHNVICGIYNTSS